MRVCPEPECTVSRRVCSALATSSRDCRRGDAERTLAHPGSHVGIRVSPRPVNAGAPWGGMTSAYATFPIQGGHNGRSSGDRPRAVQWGCDLTRSWRPPPGLAAARACAWCGYHHTDLRVLNLRSGRGARLSNALAHGSQAMHVGFCEIAAARLDGRLSIRPLEPPALDIAATFAALAAAEVLDGPQYRPRKRLVEFATSMSCGQTPARAQTSRDVSRKPAIFKRAI